MVDGNSTTLEWKQHESVICVLPIGSYEQHGAHLPLSTDWLLAGAIARKLAEDLDAALLPTLPFGTSLEHAGFCGTVSLKPTTLMQIVRDITDEAERNGFKYLLVVNGHGGNHCLIPAIRQINREDRPIKLLHLYTAQARPSAGEAPKENFFDIHAGEQETSLMLHKFPELVREKCFDRPDEECDFPLEQIDLTTFGIAHFNPEGIIGRPSSATAETGRVLFEGTVEYMLSYVKDRIRRLEKDDRYGKD